MDLTEQTRNKKKLAVLESLAKGNTVKAASQQAHCCRDTIYRWMREDPKFRDGVTENKTAAISIAYAAMFRKGIGYRYAECQVEQEHIMEEGQPVRGEHGAKMIKRKRRRLTKEHTGDVAAMDLWLRNHDPDYVQRIQPSDGSGTAAELAAELRHHMAELDKPDMAPPTEDGT